ncbi:midasin-like, partial [Tropilaelaps mercedesae]
MMSDALAPRLEILNDLCRPCRVAVETRCSKNNTTVVESLSAQLLVGGHTKHIQEVFPDLLIDLLNRCERQNTTTTEQLGCALARLIGGSRNSRQIASWAEEYFTAEGAGSLLERFSATNAEQPPTKKCRKALSDASEVDVLRAAHFFLCTDPDLYGSLWDWSCLMQILLTSSNGSPSGDNIVLQWIACNCVAVLCRLSPSDLDSLVRKYVKNDDAIVDLRQQEFHASIEIITRVSLERVPSLGDARCFTVDVEGITLLKNRRLNSRQTQHTRGRDVSSQMVRTPSMRLGLRETASAVLSARPVLITGSVGVGKTLLVEEMARLTGNTLVKVQLGNHADSKTLVGSYCCTDIPGKFRWQPGLVSQAVTRGQWLLLEDLDFAPVDIVTLLMPLLQERKLPGAGLRRGGVKAAGGFRLFATMRLLGEEHHHGEGHSELMGSCQAIEGLLTKIHLSSPSDSDLEQILGDRTPVLQPFLSKIIHLYRQVQARLREESHCKRIISPRDLVKLAERLSENFRLECTNPETLFLDAVDCLVEFVDSPELKLTVAQTCVGPVFNMGPNEVEHVVQQRKPTVMLEENTVTVGRCSVKKRPLASAMEKLQLSVATDQFAPTRVSLNVLERITRCVTRKEPVLLVGETGTGKTTVVQHLARHTNNHLVVININQQTDLVDLVGGFKPVSSTYTVLSFINQLRELLGVRKKLLEGNRQFFETLMITYERRALGKACAAIADTCQKMVDAVGAGIIQIGGNWANKLKDLGTRAHAVKAQLISDQSGNERMSFAFIEGSLVEAMRKGHWVLLDEINLAETEMLECLATILEHGQLVLQENGEIDPIQCHPNFRIFACMNPATDIGKKDLPVGIRNRFTELYFEEIIQSSDLQLVAHSYLGGASPTVVGRCVDLYLRLRKLGQTKLADGTGHRPHYSLRTLCRAMRFAGRMIQDGQQADRSIYEGFCLSFLTQMDPASHKLVQEEITRTILGHKAGGLLGEQLKRPSSGVFAQFEGYWVSCGEGEVQKPEDYILTDTVRKNLKDLARAVSANQHPVLLQGETSVGKTSMITYLAKCTGNICVRVNNHEHTDITEYVGQYTADENGALVFKEGILVEAMRKGYWIILDELNLACSEILEALNRVLDDNRKLFIPESQTEVTAHPKFMLFATQNPPGTYAGRKMLSRAFRNRFVELHFNELPSSELVTILSKRCAVSPKHAMKMVNVMAELQLERKGSGIFAGKQGFITLRDLFRWAERHRRVERSGYYDWDQLLAEEGYMLLAGRVRRASEEQIIRQTLKKIFKRDVDTDALWTSSDTTRTVREMLDKWDAETNACDKEAFAHL